MSGKVNRPNCIASPAQPTVNVQFFNSSLLLHLGYCTFSACYQSTSLKSPDPIHIIPLCLALTFSLINKKLCSFYSKLVKAWIIPFQRGVAIKV